MQGRSKSQTPPTRGRSKSQTPPTRAQYTSPIRNNSLFLRLHKWCENLPRMDDSQAQSGTNPGFKGYTSQVTGSSERFGSTIWVHNLGLQVWSTSWAHKLGPQVGSTSRVRMCGEGGGGGNR